MDKAKISNSFEEAPPSSKQRPITSILHEVGAHLTEILRSEVRLARVEVEHDAKKVAAAGAVLGIGAVLALYAVGFMLLGAVYAIAQTLTLWASSLIVGGGVGILAAILLILGRKKMRVASLRPDTTIESVQENVTWLKRQIK